MPARRQKVVTGGDMIVVCYKGKEVLGLLLLGCIGTFRLLTADHREDDAPPLDASGRRAW